MRRYAIQRKVLKDGLYVWETVLNFDAQACSKESLAAWLNTGMKVDWRVVPCVPDKEIAG